MASLSFWLAEHRRAVLICVVFLVLLLGISLNWYSTWLDKGKVQLALSLNRDGIKIYHDHTGEFPPLKGDGIDFWEIEKNPCFVLSPTLKNGKPAPEVLFNPISGKFDWLAEDANGSLYSPTMPDSVLFASPPIRVVNIRCPLTASDPPFFEDFTKW